MERARGLIRELLTPLPRDLVVYPLKDEIVDDWPKLREMILHRDGKCMNCGGIMGLAPHHITSRGAGGQDTEENLITLCMFCHTAAHNGYIVPGRRMERSQAIKKRILFYEGERMRVYFRALLSERYGYSYG